MFFTAAWLAIGNMLTHWSLNFLELVERFFWDKPEHTVSLLTFELTAVEKLANSLSGEIENSARFRDGVELIGNHGRHALILTAINRTVKFRCPPQKCDVLNTGVPDLRQRISECQFRLGPWPDVALEKPPARVPVALTREELVSVKAAIQREEMPPGSAFWLALFLVIWDTAERINAVLTLTWDRVDLAAGWVRYQAEDRKGATADNVLPIAADTVSALQVIRRREGLVFRWPYSATYIYRRLGRVMQRAGLPDNRLYKFHSLRKSVASHYEAAGGNATELLGHSSRKITRAYLDPRIVRRTSAIDFGMVCRRLA